MTNCVKSLVLHAGVSGTIVDAECHITNGLPSVVIIGHATKAVDEAKERLRASFSNAKIEFPKKRITINLAPADVQKDSTSLDLPMAVSIMLAANKIVSSKTQDVLFLGELKLDGTLNSVRGIIGRITAAKKAGFLTFYIPATNLDQALLVPGIKIKPAQNLAQIYHDLSAGEQIKTIDTGVGILSERAKPSDSIDISEIAGHHTAKRALEIAAAGHHNILLHGPPGTGKTMLARSLCGILPSLTHNEILEVTNIHSLENSTEVAVITERPFRAPHHTASATSIVGGGSVPKPGEISLAHKGVLFLDEIPEFRRDCLEALRQPLESGVISVARSIGTSTYPADFILVATNNPCPCGFYGTSKMCVCTASSLAKYRKKLSGPIMDRIDLHVSVDGVKHGEILSKSLDRPESPLVAKRVQKAYQSQQERLGVARTNSSMSNSEVKRLANLSTSAEEFLERAAEKLEISARSYVRAIKVARTICDLDDQEMIEPPQISEALAYRQNDLT